MNFQVSFTDPLHLHSNNSSFVQIWVEVKFLFRIAWCCLYTLAQFWFRVVFQRPFVCKACLRAFEVRLYVVWVFGLVTSVSQFFHLILFLLSRFTCLTLCLFGLFTFSIQFNCNTLVKFRILSRLRSLREFLLMKWSLKHFPKNPLNGQTDLCKVFRFYQVKVHFQLIASYQSHINLQVFSI